MKLLVCRSLLVVFVLLFSIGAYAVEGEQGAGSKLSKYVNVKFEVYGLEESVGALKAATHHLSKAMKRIESENGNLDKNDLKRIERISNNMKGVVIEVTRTLKEVGPSIKRARDPTIELATGIIEETRKKAIDPIINSVVDSLMIVAILLLAIIVVLGTYLLISLRKIHSLTELVRETLNQGEIVLRLRDESTLDAETSP